jgi:hypothetical protein
MLDEAKQVLQRLVPQLQEEGYVVFIEPTRQLLPEFMEGYTPDAVALRDDKNLAIEVLVEGPSAKTKETQLKHRFESRKDWELRFYYVRPAGRRENLPAMATEAIDSSITSMVDLILSGKSSAAVLIGWATFEALGRVLSPEKFTRPQTPARLIEVLATDGIVTPSEADLLRKLANSRNRLIHGTLNEHIDSNELEKFVAILKAMSGVAKHKAI